MPPETPAAPPSESEAMIQRRIDQTRRRLRSVEIADGLMVLAIGMLVYFLAVAVIDHWLLVGGLGFWGRLGLWLALLGAAGAFCVVRLLPPLARRVNPLWAAATIERSRPSLKNGLVNFLLFRRRRRDVAPIVYQAMERRAAADLTAIELDEAVDRTRVIRLGYVLAGVLAAFCLYLVLSPKNPIRSAARVLWPWSNVAAPARVTIGDVEPGDTTAFYGEFVTVSAEIGGLGDDEQVLAIYGTADGQTVDQAVPMTLPAGDYRYECLLPPDKRGLQQDLTYCVAAGDCRSRPYRIEARVAPTIDVEKVLYHYPEYTGLADQVVERQGDLRAIEGTEATLHAVANAEIKPGTAEIDLGCTGRQGLRMTTDGREAVGHFVLRISPKDASAAEYDSYQIRFVDVHGRENIQPIRHRIEVVRDLPPTAQLVEPKQKEAPVAIDGTLAVKVRAVDPDFGLRRVRLRMQCKDEDLRIAPLLEKNKPERAWQGEFAAMHQFEPRHLNLEVGDRVAYWVEAEDNREPNPGVGVSDKQWIEVVGRQGGREERRSEQTANEDQSASDSRANEDQGGEAASGNQTGEAASGNQTGEAASGDQGGDQAANNRKEEGKTEEGKTQENQTGENASGNQTGDRQGDQADQGGGEKSQQRIDPDAAPGDAMQEILDDRRQEQEKRQHEGEKGVKGEKGKEAGEKGGAEQGEAGESSGEKPSEGSDDGGEKGVKGEKGKGQEGANENEKEYGKKGGAEQDGTGETKEEKLGETASDGGRPETTSAAGKDVGDQPGSSKPLNENQAVRKKPGRAGETPGKQEGDGAQSPSASKKPSDSQGETAGDRSGGGQQGGGQQADQPGVGGPGSHRAADEGALQAAEPGEGEEGTKAGEEGVAERPTGSAMKTREAEADREKSGEAASDGRDETAGGGQGEAPGKETTGKTPGGKPAEETETGPPGGGGKPGTNQDVATPLAPADPRADEANLEYARRQSALALEHLREQLAEEKSELLDRLGWKEDDARRFLKRWESMQRAAAQGGSEGAQAQEEYKDALRSLGLRPGGAELRGGGLEADQTQRLRDAGRFAPPSEWAEQFREYTRGVAGGKQSDK